MSVCRTCAESAVTVGDRVRFRGQQYPEARRHGTATVTERAEDHTGHRFVILAVDAPAAGVKFSPEPFALCDVVEATA